MAMITMYPKTWGLKTTIHWHSASYSARNLGTQDRVLIEMACVLLWVWGPAEMAWTAGGRGSQDGQHLSMGRLFKDQQASSQHGSHRLVQNFPHWKPWPQETERKVWSQSRPEPRHWHPVFPAIPMGQSSPRATQTQGRGHRSTPLDGNDERACGHL